MFVKVTKNPLEMEYMPGHEQMVSPVKSKNNTTEMSVQVNLPEFTQFVEEQFNRDVDSFNRVSFSTG